MFQGFFVCSMLKTFVESLISWQHINIRVIQSNYQDTPPLLKSVFLKQKSHSFFQFSPYLTLKPTKNS